MANRVPPPDDSIYTNVNPENIIPAKKGAWFFRKDKTFYINHEGDVRGEWHILPYTTVILPRPHPTKVIIYRTQCELWEKKSDGFLDEFRELLPKTNWKFKSYEDVFLRPFPRPFNWMFPPPTSSNDPRGQNNSKSYDENFYYLKSGSLWYRTPIALFSFGGVDDGEHPNRYNQPPFVVAPRSLPVPTSSYKQDRVELGDQTYDRDFFYIKPSKWKRSAMSVYDASNMTMF